MKKVQSFKLYPLNLQNYRVPASRQATCTQNGKQQLITIWCPTGLRQFQIPLNDHESCIYAIFTWVKNCVFFHNTN